MDKEENTISGNSTETTSSDSNHEEQSLSTENISFQNNINNTANFHFDSSARIANIQRGNMSGRSSSPPPPSSNQENRPNIIQRRRSTPSWTLSREVKYIKKDRRKKNVEQMLVVFQNDKNDIGRWIDVSELNCPQLIEEYWERKKQMKESNLINPNNGDKQPSTKKTGARTIKEIIGMIPSQEHKYIFAVIFNDSTNQDYILWKEMRKYYPKQLLKFYESHIDQDNFIIAPPSSVSSILPEIQQLSQQQSQPQIIQPPIQQIQRHHHQQQQKPQQTFTETAIELIQPVEPQPQNTNTEDTIKEDEITIKNDTNNNNPIPIFLMNTQNSQISRTNSNPPVPKIQMIQQQVQLQRMTNTPQPKEPTRTSKPQVLSQLIQQNSMIMNRK